MKIKFKDLANRDEPLRLEGDLDIGRLVGKRRDVTQYSPVHAALEASLMAGIVRVDGQLDGEIVFSCSRCLNEVKQNIHVPFQEAFSQNEEFDDENNDDEVFYIAQDEFDLVPYLEAALLLEIPFVALCREDCRGLCPECGTNRNESDCACNTERIDPRLAELQKFYDQ